MNAYKALAASYDSLTLDVDYDGVVEFYEVLLQREGLSPRSVVDLACGTGSLTVRLAQKGYKVMGVDLSEDMLTVASQKAWDLGLQIPFVRQPLEKLYLHRGVDLAVCGLDSLDYVTDPACCKRAIERIYKALNPGGCFIFDVNTPEKLRAMDGQVFLDENEDTFCVWRGEFDEQTNICSYGMDLFRRHEKGWQRSFEEHQEYAYSATQLVEYLKDAGFTRIEVFGDRRLEPPAEGEQRIYLKARKGIVK